MRCTGRKQKWCYVPTHSALFYSVWLFYYYYYHWTRLMHNEFAFRQPEILQSQIFYMYTQSGAQIHKSARTMHNFAQSNAAQNSDMKAKNQTDSLLYCNIWRYINGEKKECNPKGYYVTTFFHVVLQANRKCKRIPFLFLAHDLYRNHNIT